MRLSTKSRFAVTAMIDVALREDRGPVSLSAISERHQISLSYLEQLFSKLRQHQLVESTRGPGGGYSLARSAEKIRKRPGRTEYQRGVASYGDDGALTVTVLPNQGSGVLSGMVRANCLVVLSHEQATIEVGDAVTVWWLDRFI